MACSPLLEGITDPAAILAVVREHPILLCSEPPQTFRPLETLGWVEYDHGGWRITKEGHREMPEKEGPPEFWEL